MSENNQKIISKEELARVAHLARLELSEKEGEKFTKDINSILSNFEDLSKLELDFEVEEELKRVVNKNSFREDNVEVFENREGILEIFPDREDDFLKTKKVL